MESPQPIGAARVLSAVMELRRRGHSQLLERLEQQHPDLAEYAMENLSVIHREILKLGGQPRQTQAAYRQIEALVLIGINAALGADDTTAAE